MVAIHGGDQLRTAGEVSVNGADADAGAIGDDAHRGLYALLDEHGGRSGQQCFTIAFYLGLSRANRLRHVRPPLAGGTMFR
ncbi:hypothetical protein GCM10011490_08030 [Pseudoclavibacter endophyticus]|nr:hypothetical protein GCM10011490_08030 [Pseudoclavibacter endophyticus]